MLAFPAPGHMPCADCGASVARDDASHTCTEERRLDFALFQLRDEVEAFEVEYTGWLDTPHGRFELFCAERARRA